MTQQGDSTRSRGETRSVDVDGVRYAYRELGLRSGVPLVALTHLGATLDGWDPAVLDALGEHRRVVAIGYRGVGSSTGRVHDSIEAMATDAVAVIRALGYDTVDLLGMSMGGMVAQAVAAQAPDLLRRVVLAGSGPAGGPGLSEMTRVTWTTTARALATFRDPKELLFFTRTDTGRAAAKDYLARLRLRTTDREPAAGPGVFRAQLAAVRRWATSGPVDLSALAGRTLLVHGEADRMVPVGNLWALARLVPDAPTVIYPDSGHGAPFQNHRAFVATVSDFLAH